MVRVRVLVCVVTMHVVTRVIVLIIIIITTARLNILIARVHRYVPSSHDAGALQDGAGAENQGNGIARGVYSPQVCCGMQEPTG